MYDKDALKRMISKKGLKETLRLLNSPDFPEAIKNELAKDDLFDRKGTPNIKLISSLRLN